jgi:hypothetical protein
MNEAISWKVSLEAQIAKLEFKPMLPPTADPKIISSILGLSRDGSGYRVAKVCEGMRLLELLRPVEGTRCGKSQIVVRSAPFEAFLALMDGRSWPSSGSSSLQVYL